MTPKTHCSGLARGVALAVSLALAAPVVLEEVGSEGEPGAPATQTAQRLGQSTAQLMESWQGC